MPQMGIELRPAMMTAVSLAFPQVPHSVCAILGCPTHAYGSEKMTMSVSHSSTLMPRRTARAVKETRSRRYLSFCGNFWDDHAQPNSGSTCTCMQAMACDQQLWH